MNIQIFGKSKCFDSKKAERYFKERNIKVQYIDLAKKAMSKGELTSVIGAIGSIEAVLNPTAKDYALIKYLAYDEDKIEKLIETPLALATPIVRNGKKATVGYCPDVWSQWE